MNKKTKIDTMAIILLIAVVGVIMAFTIGLKLGDDFRDDNDIIVEEETETLPSELPEEIEEKEEEGKKFEKCETVDDCTGIGVYEPKNYYNRDCEGEWRCMESPFPDTLLCTYGCPNNVYCGDGICGGFETEWDCIDCLPTIGFIGDISIG